MLYVTTTPWWLKILYKQCVWNLPNEDKVIYLSFDDGPHPTITSFVLDELNKYNAKATFFCIGKNVVEYESTYRRIVEEGHSVGNHTQNHLNGWNVSVREYLQNVNEAVKYIDSNLFRPPYGKIKRRQISAIKKQMSFNIVMWSVLSADFDLNVSPEQCFKNVIEGVNSGSIIVFHDSEKAFKNLEYALPKALRYFTERGFVFKKISL